MTDHTNFLNIINSSQTLKDRWGKISMQVIEDVRERYGVQIEPDDVLAVREARLAALGDGELSDEDYQGELERLPQIVEYNRREAIAAGDEDARSSAVSELNKISDVHHSRRTDANARKMARARNLGMTTAPVTADDRDEKLRTLRDIEDHQTRLKLGRKWGLI